MKKFPHTIVFSSIVKCFISKERDKYLSLASLDDIKKIIPNVNADENIDLLPIAANAFVANRFNKNGDGIDGETAVKYAKNFVNKPINIGHNRNTIVGTILNYGFTEFGSDKELNEEELNDTVKNNKPFNVTLGGVIWRIVNESLTEYIEETNEPDSENYAKASFSWEIGFADYDLYLIKGESRNLEDAEKVPDNKKSILEANLKQTGGNGKVDDNIYIYRLAKGEVLPLGIGITDKPAADVQGIAINDTEKKVELSISEKQDVFATENNEKTSLLNKNNVITNELNNNAMSKKITKIEEITEETLKQVSASDMTDFIKEQITLEVKNVQDKADSEKLKIETDAKALNEKIATIEKQSVSLTEENTKLKSDIEQLNAKLIALENAEKQRQALEVFSSRMSELDEAYKFEDKQREVVANDIRDLDEAGFTNYKNKLNVLMQNKVNASQETSSQKTVEDVINDGKKEKTEVPNTTSAGISLKDKMKAAFSVDTGVILLD